jgi:hypothetical protein
MQAPHPHCQAPVDPAVYGRREFKGDTARSEKLKRAFEDLSSLKMVRVAKCSHPPLPSPLSPNQQLSVVRGDNNCVLRSAYLTLCSHYPEHFAKLVTSARAAAAQLAYLDAEQLRWLER